MNLSAVATGAIGVGAVLGTVLRNVPVAAADLVHRGTSGGGCGIEAAVDCAFRELPDTFGQLLEFAFIVLAVTAASAATGVLLAALGLRHLRRRATGEPETATGPGGSGLTALGSLAMGVAFVMPGIWLVLAFAASLVG